MKMNKKAIPVLLTLEGVMRKHHKNYCYPSQETIRKNMRTYYGINQSLRQLNYDLAAMVEAGLIERTVRHKRDKLLGWVFKSTLYKLSKSAWLLVSRARGSRINYQLDVAENSPTKNKGDYRPARQLDSGLGMTSLRDILPGILDGVRPAGENTS